MPGANCAVVSCGTHRGTNKVLSFFKIRQPKYPEWERALVAALNRCDTSFNLQRATICSRHFTPDCLVESKPGGRRSLVPGSLPTLWMLEKSVKTPKAPPRKAPMEREAPPLPQIVAYYNFDELRRDVSILPSPWVLIKDTDEEIVVGVVEESTLRLRVTVSTNFRAKVFVYGFLVKSHENVDIEDTRLARFLTTLQGFSLCPGVVDGELQKYAKLPCGQNTQMYFKHVVYFSAGEATECSQTVRSSKCLFLQSSTEPCKECKYSKFLLQRKNERAVKRSMRPLKKNDPLFAVSFDTLKESLKKERKHSKRIQRELDKFKKVLDDEKKHVNVVGSQMHDSLKNVLESGCNKMQPLQKLFWQEQIKAFNCISKNGMRWHPTMIRLAILLHSRSPAAYETLQKTGVLHLPGESTLRDYTNFSSPQEGFSSESLDNIRQATKNHVDHKRFVVLLHDEMSIRSDLVFDNRTGELVGFVKAEGNKRQLATHVLVFYVVGVSSNLRASMGYFGTTTATSQALFPLFWMAIGQLELSCGLKVIASVSDKATPNQRLYEMHGAGDAICYKAKNLFARERAVFFISDPPHLIKTVRNNLSKSGSGKNTKMLFINGQHILWRHILDVYEMDCSHQLRMTKLTAEHVNLTPSSVMSVRLAAQVLSERVGKVLEYHGGPECRETARFVLLFNKFFDCMNARAKTEGMRKRNPNLEPYSYHNDERFRFFEEMLQYLQNWKQSVHERAGTQAEKNKMFLSHQTFKGLYITLKAFPEAVKYLLDHGVEFVLSNRFCQDPIEKHFGRHRGLGRRCDNPTLWAFGYGDNKLRVQRSLANAFQPRGNITRKREADEEIVVSSSPMKKRKKNRYCMKIGKSVNLEQSS